MLVPEVTKLVKNRLDCRLPNQNFFLSIMAYLSFLKIYNWRPNLQDLSMWLYLETGP